MSELDEVKAERDAALAIIEQVRTAAQEGLADCDDDFEMSSLWVLEATTQPSAFALAKVKADALRYAADLLEHLRPETGPQINVSQYRQGKADAVTLARPLLFTEANRIEQEAKHD